MTKETSQTVDSGSFLRGQLSGLRMLEYTEALINEPIYTRNEIRDMIEVTANSIKRTAKIADVEL